MCFGPPLLNIQIGDLDEAQIFVKTPLDIYKSDSDVHSS